MAHSVSGANSEPSRLANGGASPSLLAQWIASHETQLNLSIKGRFRGSSLHLLCEYSEHPNAVPSQAVVGRYFQSVADYTTLSQLTPPGYPRIRHLWLYGRLPGAQRPSWTVPIHLKPAHRRSPPNRKPLLDRDQHPEGSPCEFSSPASPGALQTVSPDASDASSPDASLRKPDGLVRAQPSLGGSTQGLSVQDDRQDLYSLAEQGHPAAIAAYLQDALADFGVQAKVKVKVQQHSGTANDRLWIFCRGLYSPAAALIGHSIARQLRALSLRQVDDALLQFRVSGEDTPAWVLRIDLTPQEEVLNRLARWGDVEAISRLVNQALRPLNGQLAEATLKDITLHLTCTPAIAIPSGRQSDGKLGDKLGDKSLGETLAPDHLTTPDPTTPDPTTPGSTTPDPTATALILDGPATREGLTPLLERLAPQGIRNVVIYGKQRTEDTPLWVEWINLPTQEQLDRGVSPFTLASNGDSDAIAFLLQRLLNPNLDEQLATGGVRVQVRQKARTLHIMCDGPQCPDRDEVIAQAEPFLQSLDIAASSAICLYGRRAGQRQPRWRYYLDAAPSHQLQDSASSEPSPQFAATDASYVTELVTPTPDSPFRPDLTPADVWAHWSSWQQRVGQTIRRSLLKSQLVIPTASSPELMLRTAPRTATVTTAAVWAAVAVLALFQVDLGLRYVAQRPLDGTLPLTQGGGRSGELVVTGTPPTPAADPGSDPQSVKGEAETGTGANPAIGQSLETLQSTLLNSPYPSFNSDQLDYKLALYYQRLVDVGPPDILVIGSSRALRGIDPVELEQALASLGHDTAEVFNFGINGATAQVVELILQRILLPEQLPKLIVWADGARAFNSGRDDRTYNGIIASEGYELLKAGAFTHPSFASNGQSASPSVATPAAPVGLTQLSQALAESYKTLDDRLSDRLAQVSQSYGQRDRLKAVLQDRLTAGLPQPSAPSPAPGLDPARDGDTAVADETAPSPDPAILESPASLSAIENIDADGFLPLNLRFDPSQYYQQYARVPGNYDKDYSNFRVVGTQGEALNALLALSQSHSVPIVFINMPLTQDYLDAFRMSHEQTFRQHMLNVSLQQENFIFRDLGQLWLEQPDHRSFFSDPSHLNRYGASEVSQHISQDPMIPWAVTHQ